MREEMHLGLFFFSERKRCRAERPPLPFWLIGVEGSQHISRGALSCRIGPLLEKSGGGGGEPLQGFAVCHLILYQGCEGLQQ